MPDAMYLTALLPVTHVNRRPLAHISSPLSLALPSLRRLSESYPTHSTRLRPCAYYTLAIDLCRHHLFLLSSSNCTASA